MYEIMKSSAEGGQRTEVHHYKQQQAETCSLKLLGTIPVVSTVPDWLP